MIEIMLTPENIAPFAHMIPACFQQDLQEGNLTGVGGMDEYYDNEPVAVLLCRVEHGWMEIVWLCTDHRYLGMGYGRQLLRIRLEAAMAGGQLWGAFMDLPGDADEARLPLERMLAGLGFQMKEISYPVYSATLTECTQIGILHRSLPFHSVVPLGKAEPWLLQAVIREIQKDGRPVPLPSLVHWEDYDPQMSGIYTREDRPVSLLLLRRTYDTLTIRCAWSSNPAGIVTLLSYALQQAENICPGNTIIEVPAISEASGQLVEKIFPHTEPLQTTQARLQFSKTEAEAIFENE